MRISQYGSNTVLRDYHRLGTSTLAISIHLICIQFSGRIYWPNKREGKGVMRRKYDLQHLIKIGNEQLYFMSAKRSLALLHVEQ